MCSNSPQVGFEAIVGLLPLQSVPGKMQPLARFDLVGIGQVVHLGNSFSDRLKIGSGNLASVEHFHDAPD